MPILDVKNLTKHMGPVTLFEGIGFTIDEGEKVGLIGRNGCGKSTLFHILLGDQPYDDGKIAWTRGATTGVLFQDPSFAPDATPQSVVAEVFAPLIEAIAGFERVSAALATQHEDASLLSEQAHYQVEIERLGGWTWQHRVDDVLLRLGIERDHMDRPMHALSGGQRRRVGLARELLAKPDLLMLDEPTNHLDAETIEWLEVELSNYPGAILLVTHDRYFLEHVVTRIMEFDEDGIVSTPGNYSVFMERKLERFAARQKAAERRVKLYEKELDWMRRGPKARSTKAKGRIKRFEELEAAGGDRIAQERELELSFSADHRLGGVILEAEGLQKRFGTQTVLDGVGFSVRRMDKLGIVGPNGCGKTTLLDVLAGRHTLDGGDLRWGKNSRVAYLDQQRSGLDDEVTVFDELGPAEMLQIGKRSVHKRTYLQEFLFTSGDQRKKVGSLSGGERCRLLLAKLIKEGANFIVLDEPTNDLDIQSLQALEDALVSFDGCVLLVSHDRYFMNRVCDAVLAFEDGAFTRYDGDYDFYKARRDAARRQVKEAEKARAKAADEQQRAAAKPVAKARKLSWKEREELDGIEAVIEATELEKDAVEGELANPEIYRTHSDVVATLTAQLTSLQAELETLYARWEELEGIAAG